MAPLTTDEPGAIGPYQVVGRLGDGPGGPGGPGGLFLGRAPEGERVAITAVPADLAVDPGFRAEVAAARTVNVPAVAPVVDADLDGPVPWLATAYLAGPTLAEAVRDNGPMPADLVLELAAWLAEGLRAWHAAGLVLRNLTPAHIVLASGGPRVIGFGTLAPASGGLSGTESGSAGFWSPEQALGQDAGPPSDIFSLGAVLVFAGGGVGPFGSGSSALLMYRVVNSPASLDGVAGELRALVGSCLAKEPGERPSASRVLAELEAIRSGAGEATAAAVAGGAVVAGPSAAGGPSAVGSPSAAGRDSAGASRAASERGGGRGGGRGGRGGRHSRRGWPGSRAGGWIAGGVLAAACIVAIFFLSGGDPLSSAGNVQPQAGARIPGPDSTSQAPLSTRSSPPVPSGSLPAGHRNPPPAGGITPATLQGPSPSSFLSPSVPSHALSQPSTSASRPPTASTSASPSPSKSASPSPSKSASPSPSASKSPSPSPSASKSPSPSPSPSKSPSPSPSKSPSPSASQTAASPSTSSSATSAAAAPSV